MLPRLSPWYVVFFLLFLCLIVNKLSLDVLGSQRSFLAFIKGGDKLTLSLTGPTPTNVTATTPTSPKPPEPNSEKTPNRCTTPVTVTFFGHSDKGKLEKKFLQSPESKGKKALSLAASDIDIEDSESSESTYNSLETNGEKPKVSNVSSNPFLNINNTNPFHNAFFITNPFKSEDEADSMEKAKDVEEVSTVRFCFCMLLCSFPGSKTGRSRSYFCFSQETKAVTNSNHITPSLSKLSPWLVSHELVSSPITTVNTTETSIIRKSVITTQL